MIKVKSSERLIFPTYTLSSGLVLNLVWAVLFKQKRDFKKDAVEALKGLRPDLVIHGQEYVPVTGPCLITLNHYFRPGYNAFWTSLAISAAVPLDIFWIMTGAFTYPGQRREKVLKPMSQWLLHAIGRVYGFSNMPAMPPNPSEAEERALAVRQVVTVVRRRPHAVIGLAPEGRDILTGKLGEPPSGSGRFIQYLARLGLPILPVGVFEADSSLQVNFGRLFCLEETGDLSSTGTDRAVCRIVMQAIARQLPDEMRGIYA